MHNIKIMLVLQLGLLVNVYSQNVTIKEVIDANLFKLSDGRIVKLAGVDAPNDSSAIPYLRQIAGMGKDYLSKYKNVRLKLDSVSINEGNGYITAILYKQYTLEDLCLNEVFLMNGLGKYYGSINRADSSRFIEAEEKAKRYEFGIWRFFSPTKNDTLDQNLKVTGSVVILKPDSTKMHNFCGQKPVAGMIAMELLAGTGITIVSMYAGVGLASLNSNNTGWAILGGAVIGFAAGYCIGFPTMIYLIAKEENPNLNIWENFACSWGLTLATGFIASLIHDTNHPMHYLAFLSPVIGSLVYAHLLAPQTAVKNNTLLIPDKKISNFYEFREAQTTRIELLRIYF